MQTTNRQSSIVNRQFTDDLTDHEAIDLLRRVGVRLLRDVEGGHEISATEIRLIVEMVRGILGRNQIQDDQQQLQAFHALLEQAAHVPQEDDEPEESSEL